MQLDNKQQAQQELAAAKEVIEAIRLAAAQPEASAGQQGALQKVQQMYGRVEAHLAAGR